MALYTLRSRCMLGIVVSGVSGAGPDGGAGAAAAAAAAGLGPARRLHRPSGRRLVRAGAAPAPVPAPLLVPVPSGVSRCRLAGTVPEEPRCTVERADASLTYSLFLQRYGGPGTVPAPAEPRQRSRGTVPVHREG